MFKSVLSLNILPPDLTWMTNDDQNDSDDITTATDKETEF